MQSPYFNDSEENMLFFGVLDGYMRKGIDSMTREHIWTTAFGKKKFNEQKYRRYASDLTKLAYRFLSLEWQERDGFAHGEGLLKKVNADPLTKHYKTALRNFRNKLDESGIQDASYYYYRYISEYESHIHLERTHAKRSTLSNLQDADHNLDIFYIINKLKHYCDSVNYKTFLSIEIDVKLLPRLTEFIHENDYLEIPAVNIYYRISKTLDDAEDTSHYFKLVDLLEKYYALFNRSELRTLYIYATNYCITQINIGNKDFYRVLYNLYFTLLARKTIFNQEDELDERHYKNIVSLGVQLKEYDGVEAFIRGYSPMLHKGVRDNALFFNLAHVYYAKEEFGKVIEQLSQVEYNDLAYALGGRFMLLKTYYEIGEFTAFEAQLDSFNIYMRRNKLVSGDMKTQYMNCLKFMRKMYNTPRYEKDNLKKLRDKIDATVKVVSKGWLLEKVDELI